MHATSYIIYRSRGPRDVLFNFDYVNYEICNVTFDYDVCVDSRKRKVDRSVGLVMDM